MALMQSASWSKGAMPAAFALCLMWIGVSGCGTPGAPRPPSLKLPELVNDLAAVRSGNNVTLHWTMPKRTTDRLLISSEIRGPVPVRVCRREGAAGTCEPAGEVAFLPSAEGEFQETLPMALSSGEPRQLLYCVELMNKTWTAGKSGSLTTGRSAGRSAGFSNSAIVAAGSTPGPITNLRAEVRADGVALRWNCGAKTAVRLHRKLLTSITPKANPEKGLMKPTSEPVLQDLLVDAPATEQKSGMLVGRTLDTAIRFGEAYEYTAQSVVRVTVDGKVLELTGDISSPVRVEAIDTFPPAVPIGLVAVFVPDDKTIDLSWSPDSESDLAGYFVYRTEEGQKWSRVSGAQALVGPAFRDLAIQAGHTYRYAVTAIDITGHESKRSAEAVESVPEMAPNP